MAAQSCRSFQDCTGSRGSVRAKITPGTILSNLLFQTAAPRHPRPHMSTDTAEMLWQWSHPGPSTSTCAPSTDTMLSRDRRGFVSQHQYQSWGPTGQAVLSAAQVLCHLLGMPLQQALLEQNELGLWCEGPPVLQHSPRLQEMLPGLLVQSTLTLEQRANTSVFGEPSPFPLTQLLGISWQRNKAATSFRKACTSEVPAEEWHLFYVCFHMHYCCTHTF